MEALPLTVKIIRPDGQEARSLTWHVRDGESKDLNYYETEIDFPADAQTGKWQVRVWDDPAVKDPASVYEIQVEEFLPERMKLEMTASPDFPASGDTVRADITGLYLYGAPAAENEIGF